MDIEQEILKIKIKLNDLKKRWPAHSVKPQMVEELDQLEKEMAQLTKIRQQVFANNQVD